jgi:hypothetical protein
MLALILLGLMTLSALAWPIYYIRVARPWRNPIGRLMLGQAAVVLLYVSRSWYGLLTSSHPMADPSPFGIITGIIMVILLNSFIPVYAYVRKKELHRDRSRL